LRYSAVVCGSGWTELPFAALATAAAQNRYLATLSAPTVPMSVQATVLGQQVPERQPTELAL